VVGDTVIGGANRFRHPCRQHLPDERRVPEDDGGLPFSVTKTGRAEFAMQNVTVSDVGDWFVNSGLVRYEYNTTSMARRRA